MSMRMSASLKWQHPSALMLMMSWVIICICMQANSVAEAWMVVTPQSSSLFGRQSMTVSTLHGGHDRRGRRSILLASSPSTHPDVSDGVALTTSSSTPQEKEVPIVRTLYDAPPRLPTDDNNDDSNNNTTTSLPNNGWVTKVTSGTLPTEEGSSHVLYYEVHRRFFRCDDAEVETDAGSGQQNQHSKKNSSDRRGLTALFLHGGPGAACFPNHVRFFSPELYETVVLLDQRGCGRSTPLGETRNNTLELLVDDVERLRVHLPEEEGVVVDDAVPAAAGVRPCWDVILGGSWGCTLALAYAHTYPQHVRAMVLRGVCLFRPQEIDWLFAGDPPSLLSDRISEGINSMRTSNLRSLLMGNENGVPRSTSQFRRGEDSEPIAQTTGTTLEETTEMANNTASKIFPKGWQEFCKGSNIAKVQTPTLQQGTQTTSPTAMKQRTSNNPRSILNKYYNLLMGSDPLLRFTAVKSWMRWEMGIYSAGFPESQAGKDGKVPNQNNDENGNTLLVWNPVTESWTYEDARVCNNQSVASIGVDPNKVEDTVAQSLRRFSSTPSSPSESQSFSESIEIEPIPIQPVVKSPGGLIPTAKADGKSSSSSSNSNNNSNFDPSTYIPAQSMLTCYYSTNDNYCIGPYKPFMSLTPPPSVPLSSWYSSKLPPQLPQRQSSPILPTSTPESSISLVNNVSPPLPPTIAIQGGNDAICPPDTALDLHHVWNEMELRIVLESGHSMYDTVIAGEIVKALDRFGHDLGAAE